MNDNDLIRALRRIKVETGSLVCLGCGHEHNCSTHGCAVINKAVKRLEADQNTTLGGTYVSVEWFKSVEAKLKGYEKLAKEGRLVVLPCKLHETIFYLEDGEVFDDVPYKVSLGQKQGEWNDSLAYECQYGFCFYAEDIGKTVFLTSDEAEEALKKREGGMS